MSSSEGNSLGPDGRQSSRFVLDFADLTVFGKKVLHLLDSIADVDKPDAWAFAECHLMGSYLGAARRRLRNLGWKTLVTPAVPRMHKEVGLDDPATAANHDDIKEDEAEANKAAKHHNSGGEMLLFRPSLIVHGHHQSPAAVGYRAAQVRFKGWTLHLITM